MAGIIDIRYNYKTRRWTAKPRFAWNAETYRNGIPSAEGLTPADAAYRIAELLPEEMGRRLSWGIPRRIYRSPEYEWMNDKCIEVDGHCPSRQEWAERHLAYQRAKAIKNVTQS